MPEVGSTARARRCCVAGAVTACSLLIAAGCQQSNPPATSAVTVELEIQPSPPRVGTADVVLTVTDASGQPASGGAIELEGNMNHAGMKPVFSRLEESEPGKYEGTLEFTMGGDWFVLVTGELAGGQSLSEKIDVPGVQRP